MRNRWTVPLLAVFALLVVLWFKLPAVAFAATSSPDAPDALAAIPLEIDDGQYEGMLGLYNYDGTGKQFLWLNRFSPGAASFPFNLEEIAVLFDGLGGSNKIQAGDPIELVVYSDKDSDPRNGARLLGHYDVKIQAVDGQTWSRYRLDPPLPLVEPGEILIGVVNRYTLDSVSAKTYPAMYDTTRKQDRSWYGWWPGGVSEPPELASAAIFKQQEGNWLVRGYGSQVPAPNPIAPPNPAPTPNPATRVRIYLPFASNR